MFNWYVDPLIPANSTPARSLTAPDAIVKVYVTEGNKAAVGWMVIALPEKPTLPIGMFVTVPLDGVSTMLPVPACTFSLKDKITFDVSPTPLEPWGGL
jgi:hypothetical protein